MKGGIEHYWGKAQKIEDHQTHHLLVAHALDAMAVASVWLEQSLLLKNRLRSADDDWDQRWLLFFIGMHDLGKFDVRFQRKVDSIACSLWPGFAESAISESTGFDHGKAGYCWWLKESEQWGLGALKHGAEWMRMVAGHHGNLNLNGCSDLYDLAADEEVIEHDRVARQQWVTELLGFLKLDPLSAANKQNSLRPPSPLLAGFCSICDWIGSNEMWFPFHPIPIPSLQNYFLQRSVQARKALEQSGLCKPEKVCAGMSQLYPEYQPRGVQTEIDQLPVKPSLLLIEAPTGSGKTEAALAYASRLLAAGHAESILFALPTQATANAMLQRLEECAAQLFPEQPSNIVLAHGKRGFNLQFINLKRAGSDLQWKEGAQVQCSEWLGSSRKRVFLGQIGVGTVDQVLLSVLPVRHNFVRQFGIGRSVLIVDEVHAYDSYMNGLLGEVIKQQKEAGGSVILLSATMNDRLRRNMVTYWSDEQSYAPKPDYPLMTHVTIQKASEIVSQEPPVARDVVVTLWKRAQLLPEEGDLQQIVAAAQSGARIAVICNLVADAQQIYQQLCELSMQTEITIDLFHSRFTFADRQQRERQAVTAFGKGSKTEGAILVATQVIEQSLDLDFDWMVTQLAPVDLLFQRMGRLHRHQRNRPTSFEKPTVTILLPEALEFAGHGVIYANHRVLWRTQQLLEQTAVLRFPEIYREWIDQVYGIGDEAEQPWENEPEEVVVAFEKYQNDEKARYYNAMMVSRSRMEPYPDTADKAATMTRDGEMGINLTLLQQDNNQKKVLLDGSTMLEIEDWQQAEMIDRNSVSVPASWGRPNHSLLPARNGNELRYLTMDKQDGKWHGETDNALFFYSKEEGLMMERKETTR